MDLDEAVRELYAAPLAEFVAVRTRLAKGTDRAVAAEIKTLRKPTVTAWLLNQLAREEPTVIASVGELGDRMRTAQAAADMAALREARPDRDRLIAEVVVAVRELAARHGRTLSAAGEDEVSSTVIAALADVESQAALGSGMLVRALSYSGFGEVDIDDAVATRTRLQVIPGGARTTPSPEHTREVHEAEVRLQTAEVDLTRATTDLAEAEQALTAARERAAEAREEVRRRTRERDEAATKASDLRRGRPRR